MIRQLLLVAALISANDVWAQYLSWFVSAQSGASNYATANVSNTVLAGFKTEGGEQFSFGPVVKSYFMEQRAGNIAGLRMYTQAPVIPGVNFYIQADLANGDRRGPIMMQAPVRLETGAGFNVMIRERIGCGLGYSFGEFNPMTNLRRSSPAFKLIYLMPFDKQYF